MEHLPSFSIMKASASPTEWPEVGEFDRMYVRLLSSIDSAIEDLNPALGLPENGMVLLRLVRASYALHSFAQSSHGVHDGLEIMDAIKRFSTLLAALSTVRHLQLVIVPFIRHKRRKSRHAPSSELWGELLIYVEGVIQHLSTSMKPEVLVSYSFNPMMLADLKSVLD